MTDPSEIVLKPCPFCGSPAERADLGERVAVGCTYCDAYGPWKRVSDHASKEAAYGFAAVAWNTRPEASALIRELAGALEACRDAVFFVGTPELSDQVNAALSKVKPLSGSDRT